MQILTVFDEVKKCHVQCSLAEANALTLRDWGNVNIAISKDIHDLCNPAKIMRQSGYVAAHTKDGKHIPFRGAYEYIKAG